MAFPNFGGGAAKKKMLAAERNETPRDEAKESKSFEAKERKMGVEKAFGGKNRKM